MNTIKKVTNIEEDVKITNNYILKDLMPAMVLNYINPKVAVSYLYRISKSDKKIEDLADKMGLIRKDGNLYDANGKLLDENFVLYAIAEDLNNMIQKCKDSKEVDYDLSRLEMVRELLVTSLLPKVSEKKEEIKTSEEDMNVNSLFEKLYGEEKGVKTR